MKNKNDSRMSLFRVFQVGTPMDKLQHSHKSNCAPHTHPCQVPRRLRSLDVSDRDERMNFHFYPEFFLIILTYLPIRKENTPLSITSKTDYEVTTSFWIVE